MSEPKLALTAKEASRAANVSLPTLYEWIKRSDQPAPAFRVGKKWLIPTDAFKAWLERQAGGSQHDQQI